MTKVAAPLLSSTPPSLEESEEGLATLSPGQVRAEIRAGRYRGHTAQLAPGFLQCNLVVLPADLADDFERFCHMNPKPCPLVWRSERGEPVSNDLGAEIDIRTDVPRYRVFRNGQLVGEPRAIDDLWRDDFCAFALGCSFTFDAIIARSDILLPHMASGSNIAMYRSNIPAKSAGPFKGSYVVSMRPVPPHLVARVVEISSRYPLAHGAPLHIGDPSEIGVGDIAKPYAGDVPEIGKDDVLVFWGCGVTPQLVIEACAIPLAITHYPGSMLITNIPVTAIEGKTASAGDDQSWSNLRR